MKRRADNLEESIIKYYFFQDCRSLCNEKVKKKSELYRRERKREKMTQQIKNSYLQSFSALILRLLLFQEFNKKSNSLYTILRSSRLAGSQRAPFLRRFLLRLNFNSFFEVNQFPFPPIIDCLSFALFLVMMKSICDSIFINIIVT